MCNTNNNFNPGSSTAYQVMTNQLSKEGYPIYETIVDNMIITTHREAPLQTASLPLLDVATSAGPVYGYPDMSIAGFSRFPIPLFSGQSLPVEVGAGYGLSNIIPDSIEALTINRIVRAKDEKSAEKALCATKIYKASTVIGALPALALGFAIPAPLPIALTAISAVNTVFRFFQAHSLQKQVEVYRNGIESQKAIKASNTFVESNFLRNYPANYTRLRRVFNLFMGVGYGSFAILAATTAAPLAVTGIYAGLSLAHAFTSAFPLRQMEQVYRALGDTLKYKTRGIVRNVV